MKIMMWHSNSPYPVIICFTGSQPNSLAYVFIMAVFPLQRLGEVVVCDQNPVTHRPQISTSWPFTGRKTIANCWYAPKLSGLRGGKGTCWYVCWWTLQKPTKPSEKLHEILSRHQQICFVAGLRWVDQGTGALNLTQVTAHSFHLLTHSSHTQEISILYLV